MIYANVSSDLRQVQELGSEDSVFVEFSYSARWTPTELEYSKRLELFKDNFFEQEMEIHWLSIMNSFVLVILLTGFIAIIILRVLKSDYTRYQAPKSPDDGKSTRVFGVLPYITRESCPYSFCVFQILRRITDGSSFTVTSSDSLPNPTSSVPSAVSELNSSP